MNIQIENSFDKKTIYKILIEAVKLGVITACLYALSLLGNLDFGTYSPIIIPAIRWLIGIIEQFKKGN